MKRPRLKIRLTEDQQLILALLLVILLAVSMLYCLGFASLTARQLWENAPLPWSDWNSSEEDLGPTPTSLPIEPTMPVTPRP